MIKKRLIKMINKKHKKIIFFHIEHCEWCHWLRDEVWVWLKNDIGHASWEFVEEDDDSDMYSEAEDGVFFYPTVVLVVGDEIVDTVVGVVSKDEYAYLLEQKMNNIAYNNK